MSDETPEQPDENGLIPAEANPWWWLANYHGVPKNEDDPKIAENRETWNKILYAKLKGAKRDLLTKKIDEFNLPLFRVSGRFPPPELRQIREYCIEEARKNWKHTFDFDGYFPFALNGPRNQNTFKNTLFTKPLFFSGCLFADEFDFQGSTFEKRAHFSDTFFLDHANLSRCTFKGKSYFSKALFFGPVAFGASKLIGNCYFNDAKFLDNANFNSFFWNPSATPYQEANFSNTDFFLRADFPSAEFHTAIFNGAKFHESTNFQNTIFQVPPRFHKTTLHSDTNWEVKSWPNNNPDGLKQAVEWKSSWSRLKLHMNAQQRHDLEQIFFCKEMEVDRCILKLKGGKYIERFSYFLYKWLSGYGQSIGLTLVWLLIFLIAFSGIYTTLGILEYSNPLGAPWLESSFWEELKLGLKISFANTLPILGIHRYFLSSETSGWIFAFSGLQSTLSLVLLFLLGLGLRNKFRIK
ncbi:pentapeptide repeat-containing protein [Emcibacter sp.]|uniref:pentapeptide repeat-containing protein n=1 Tax=Emcibacter sp. TaxID=1979954 RepID=UPI002AA73E33|nr:pentapeptide repeat-containing protein [Emcibacter sp.]